MVGGADLGSWVFGGQWNWWIFVFWRGGGRDVVLGFGFKVEFLLG